LDKTGKLQNVVFLRIFPRFFSNITAGWVCRAFYLVELLAGDKELLLALLEVLLQALHPSVQGVHLRIKKA
ncbi:MAG: hypothetical protein ACK56I_08360, partial [bacterium]